jgi:NhaA family Na+:H+ antiporter
MGKQQYFNNPVRKIQLSKVFLSFFNSEKSAGLILVFLTVLSLGIANSAFREPYADFWHTDLGGQSLAHWINDGLMTIFFLMIGLELEREIYHGELSDIRNASLPIFGALGGMLVPAGLYLLINFGTPTQSGAGIPMATDIAFAIVVLSMLGNRVPASLKIFLTALAVIDDLGAIIVISIFYTSALSLINLGIALGIFGFLLILNRMKVMNLIPYLVGGAAMWYFMSHSGVHATITGVLLAFAIPFGDGGEKSPSYILQHFLHKPVAFFILPLFAMANTCITLEPGWQNSLAERGNLGIVAGLTIGKPLGISLFAYLSVLLGLSALPRDLNWKKIIAVGFLGGIGFTMSIFITLLAYDDDLLINNSKIMVLIASILSGTIGFLWLNRILKPAIDKETA